jgi:hypothetical protein
MSHEIQSLPSSSRVIHPFGCASEPPFTPSRLELKIEQNAQQLLNRTSVGADVCVGMVIGRRALEKREACIWGRDVPE